MTVFTRRHFDMMNRCVQHSSMTDNGGNAGDSQWQEDGRIPGTDLASFTADIASRPPVPILIAVPHAGRDYPETLTDRMRHPDYSCSRLEDRLVDRIGSAVARETGAALLVAHAPRAMIDLNRATDDVDWQMVRGGAPAGWRNSLSNRRARSGLGLVPRRLAGIGEIWHGPIGREELDERVAQVHRPYHSALGQMLERLRDRWGAALLIDLHSMPPLKPGRPGDRPAQFVIGDRFGASCDGMLAAGSLRYFSGRDQRAAHNRPYAGGYVLDCHAAPRRNIHALQLEVCRSTYLDPDFKRTDPGIDSVIALLSGLIRSLAADVAVLGEGEQLPQAAE